MAFTGNEAEQITLATAIEWTSNFRTNAPRGSTLAHFFGKTIINQILAQPGCVGIRVYNSIETETGKKQLIMVGADAQEKDLYNGIIAERSFLCPPFCGDGSPLSS